MPNPESDDQPSELELSTRYAVEVEPAADREIDRLPADVAEAVWEFLRSGLAVSPRRRGILLKRPPLGGLYRAGVAGHRVIYEVDDDQYAVSVLSVRPRADAYIHPGDVSARRSRDDQ